METAPIHYMLSYSSFLKFFRVDWWLNAKELGQKMKKTLIQRHYFLSVGLRDACMKANWWGNKELLTDSKGIADARLFNPLSLPDRWF